MVFNMIGLLIQLPYLALKAGQAYWTDGQTFGVKAEGTASG